MIKKAFGYEPDISILALVSDSANIIGKVKLDEYSSVFYGAVLRGDINSITIGKYSNIQDNCTVHVDKEFPCIVKDHVTVGHNAVLHGCIIEDHCIIGMGAIILDGAKIGRGSIIAAGSVIKENQIVEPFSLVAGVPGVVKKIMNENIIISANDHAMNYVEIAKQLVNK